MKIDTEALISKRLNDNWVIDRTHPTYSGATGMDAFTSDKSIMHKLKLPK